MPSNPMRSEVSVGQRDRVLLVAERYRVRPPGGSSQRGFRAGYLGSLLSRAFRQLQTFIPVDRQDVAGVTTEG